MSDEHNPDPLENRDYKVIAAEFSLGLLEGEELLDARGRMARDPEFAARREWWDDWFVPLSDDVAGAEPGERVWPGIATRVKSLALARDNDAFAARSATQDEIPGDNVASFELERRVRRWQWTAGLTSAAAALALALLMFGPGTAPKDEPGLAVEDTASLAASPLMASIPIGDTPLRLGVTFLPQSNELLVSAAGLSADGVHDHELWLVPGDGGALQSLGVVVPGAEKRLDLPADIARHMGDGVQLVVTREPIGGKPEGRDAGPVVAEGVLGAV
jgi:anti-sigma-K factor RskA